MAEEDRAGTGEDADTARTGGWRGILAGTLARLQRDKVDIVASSAAFWALLALFPGMAAVLIMTTWALDPGAVQDQISALTEPLPDEAETFLNETAAEVAARGRAVGLGAFVAIGFAVWTASAATRTLMTGLNTAYGTAEARGFFKFNFVALILTFGMFVGFVISVVTIVVVPATLALRPGLGWTAALVDWLRWPVMAIFAMGGLATLYRFGPSRKNARWRWVSIGALAATILWILVSLGFSLYVSEFAAYNRFYGTLGGVAVLMIWFWLSAWIALAGAELNSEIEAQHRRDMSRWQSRIAARIATMRARNSSSGT
jgi:membrane protein